MFKLILILYFLLNNYESFLFGSLQQNVPDPDESIDTLELIKNKGYPSEQHDVITNDGYILTIHRIPRQNSTKVILLQHGLLDSSSTWVINYPNQSLGFILHDNDYDVWLGNMRGNRYCNRHILFNETQDEFWDFSFSDMAKYDLTAMIDYILNETNQTQLYYVGHSQGSLIKFINSNPLYLKKIKLFTALGPVAKVANMKSPLYKKLALLGGNTNQDVWFKLIGKKSFASSKFDFLINNLCNSNFTDCSRIHPNLNHSRMNVYFTHFPSGTSTKNIVHYLQMIKSKNVQMFDYGKFKNIIYYNQTSCPLYDLKKMTVPTALYYGDLDRLANPTDVKYIRKTIPNIVDYYCIKDWQHVDFVWALNAKEKIYNRMINLLAKFK